jgi:hypothetical protein
LGDDKDEENARSHYPPTLLNKNNHFLGHIILNYDPAEIARQLTLLGKLPISFIHFFSVCLLLS